VLSLRDEQMVGGGAVGNYDFTSVVLTVRYFYLLEDILVVTTGE
jgi:hypothetical protein